LRLRIQQSYDNKSVQLIVSFAVSDRDVSEEEDTNFVLAWLNHSKASMMHAFPMGVLVFDVLPSNSSMRASVISMFDV